MYSVQIKIPSDTWYELCRCLDLLSLWTVVEGLLGPGAAALQEIRIIRVDAPACSQRSSK